MPYVRPELSVPIPKAEKIAFLSEHVKYYSGLARVGRSKLNVKLPNEAFANLLEKIGELVVIESARLAIEPGACRSFLEDNQVPVGMAPFLPDSVRVFCLILNAIKQWTNKEQIAMDGFLFGRNARQLFRSLFTHCVVTGDSPDSAAELHHPVRDGRPPHLLSKKGHVQIEGQASTNHAADPIAAILIPLRREKNYRGHICGEVALTPLASIPNRHPVR